MITIERKDICTIKDQVCDSFLDAVNSSSKLDRVGNKEGFDNEVELMVYLELLDGLALPLKVNHFDNDYVSLLSNRDIFRIQSRALQIQGSTKRKTF